MRRPNAAPKCDERDERDEREKETETMAETSPKRRFTTPAGMLSYPHLFDTDAMEGQEPKYSATLVLAPDADLTTLEEAIVAAAQDQFPGMHVEFPADIVNVGGGRLAREVHITDPRTKKRIAIRAPLRYDGVAKGYPEGSVFLSARCKKDRPPVVVSRLRGENGRPVKISDPEEIYAGCQAKLGLWAHYYDIAGNRGVALHLNGAQRWADGERIGGSGGCDFEADLTREDVIDPFGG